MRGGAAVSLVASLSPGSLFTRGSSTTVSYTADVGSDNSQTRETTVGCSFIVCECTTVRCSDMRSTELPVWRQVKIQAGANNMVSSIGRRTLSSDVDGSGLTNNAGIDYVLDAGQFYGKLIL